MSNVPADLKYAKSHEWLRVGPDNVGVVGITDHAQHELTDVVFVELPEKGRTVKESDACAVVESVKTASDIYSPVSGDVTEVNAAIVKDPGLVNNDPYGAGWILRLETDDHASDESRMGAASRAWLRDENVRLTHFFESRLGMAAADGGTLTAPPVALLTDQAWQEAARSFLQAA